MGANNFAYVLVLTPLAPTSRGATGSGGPMATFSVCQGTGRYNPWLAPAATGAGTRWLIAIRFSQAVFELRSMPDERVSFITLALVSGNVYCRRVPCERKCRR
jgi:hypothetical protein